MNGLQVILTTTNIEIAEEFSSSFNKHKKVKIHRGKFQSIPHYDCLVSPGNSFGLMDGGMDKHIIEFFGTHLEKHVQEHILTFYLGEQPIGTSFVIPTYHPKFPFLAHTPTMRVPDSIERTKNVYYAMKAALSAVATHNHFNDQKIKTVVIPAFGGGTGQVDPSEIAKQMALAYEHSLMVPSKMTWDFAFSRDRQIDNL